MAAAKSKSTSKSTKSKAKAAANPLATELLAALERPLTVESGRDTSATPIHLVTGAAALDKWLEKQAASVASWVKATGFKPGAGRHLLLPAADGKLSAVLAGIGKSDDLYATAFLASALPAGKYRLASLDGTAPDTAFLQRASLAWLLADYRFDCLKTAKAAGTERTVLVVPKAVALDEAEWHARSVWLTRDLVNLPSNLMGPAELADAAKQLAKRFKDARISVLDDQEKLAAEYPAVYAVGMGSARAPRLIDISWGDPKHPKVTLVGKGVCFDTGGLDLKPSSGMLNMKKDMGGSAQALGLAHLIMASNLPVRLRVLIPAVENSVSGKAFRPRDVISTRLGITIEIGNTDAEGRLVLADALTEASRDEPELLIDFATLTGAARVALGPDLPALMSNDDQLAADLVRHGMAASDPVWQLPLWQPYASGLDNPVADTSNITTGGFAGSITAGLFLEKFIGKCPSWAHFDVFAWNPSSRPGRPEGGEAQAYRAVYALLQERYAAKKAKGKR